MRRAAVSSLQRVLSQPAMGQVQLWLYLWRCLYCQNYPSHRKTKAGCFVFSLYKCVFVSQHSTLEFLTREEENTHPQGRLARPPPPPRLVWRGEWSALGDIQARLQKAAFSCLRSKCAKDGAVNAKNKEISIISEYCLNALYPNSRSQLPYIQNGVSHKQLQFPAYM